MEFKDFLKLYCERSSAVQTFWNFYLVVYLGVLGFVLADVVEERDPFTAATLSLLLSLAFALVALVNGSGLWLAAGQRHSACEAVVKSAMSFKDRPEYPQVQLILPYIQSPTQWGTLVLHIVADVLLVGLIWTVTLWPSLH